MNALVRAIPAGDVAEIATNALLGMDARHDAVIQIQVLPLRDPRQGEAAEAVEVGETLLIHPIREAVGHVLHNAVTIVHGGGTHLQGATPEQNELGSFPPTRDAADAGDRNSDVRV